MIKLGDWVSSQLFKMVHQNNLVYNTCWEDPRIDRAALHLRDTDRIVMITSAGCNALDYAILGPREIHAIDVNYRQNALLQLKIAGIKALQYDDFFSIFGDGVCPNFAHLYHSALQHHLNDASRAYWDRRLQFFTGGKYSNTFYFRGTSGVFARTIKSYIDRKPKVRDALNEMFQADSVEEQSKIYETIRPYFWTRFVRWIMGRDSTMALLGVPRVQRQHLERHYQGGIAKFIEDCVEAVFAKLPLYDNYFWRLYIYGSYTKSCCPEYLREENFQKLKSGLVESIQTHTCTITSFLQRCTNPISRFVLLDHMDWLNAPSRRHLLAEEWQAIADKACPDARFIWRSGGLDGRFVDSLRVAYMGSMRRLGDLLTYYPEQSAELHAKDRVHTYGSFCIADLNS